MLNELGDVALLCERPLFGLEVAQRRALKAYRGFLAVDRLPVEFGLALRAVFLREGFFSCACSLVATDASDSPADPVCFAALFSGEGHAILSILHCKFRQASCRATVCYYVLFSCVSLSF